MTQRDEAMQATADAIDPLPFQSEWGKRTATAGADAELARVCHWLRDMPTALEAMPCTMAQSPADVYAVCRWLAKAIEAHAHWKEGAGDGQ